MVLFKALRSFSNFDLDLVIILTCLSKIILVCGRKKTPSGKDELSLFDGFVLFSSIGGNFTVLVDVDGNEVHRWENSDGITYGYLLDNGNLLCRTNPPKENEFVKEKNCSWMEVECLGACINAPMMQINENYYEDLDKEKALKILDDVITGKTPKHGSFRGRLNSEPENNRKTLLDVKNA